MASAKTKRPSASVFNTSTVYLEKRVGYTVEMGRIYKDIDTEVEEKSDHQLYVIFSLYASFLLSFIYVQSYLFLTT